MNFMNFEFEMCVSDLFHAFELLFTHCVARTSESYSWDENRSKNSHVHACYTEMMSAAINTCHSNRRYRHV